MSGKCQEQAQTIPKTCPRHYQIISKSCQNYPQNKSKSHQKHTQLISRTCPPHVLNIAKTIPETCPIHYQNMPHDTQIMPPTFLEHIEFVPESYSTYEEIMRQQFKQIEKIVKVNEMRLGETKET